MLAYPPKVFWKLIILSRPLPYPDRLHTGAKPVPGHSSLSPPYHSAHNLLACATTPRAYMYTPISRSPLLQRQHVSGRIDPSSKIARRRNVMSTRSLSAFRQTSYSEQEHSLQRLLVILNLNFMLLVNSFCVLSAAIKPSSLYGSTCHSAGWARGHAKRPDGTASPPWH